MRPAPGRWCLPEPASRLEYLSRQLLGGLGLDTDGRLLYNHMVFKPNGYAMNSSERLNAIFAALADPTRRAILARLALGDASVRELARPFAMSQPAISKHLKVLERARLISRGRDAQRRPRRLEAKPLAEITDWLENYRRFWEGNFQRLDALLDDLKTRESRRQRRNSKGESQ
jgi:DNA-binding transcriptional ArsR family regulator